MNPDSKPIPQALKCERCGEPAGPTGLCTECFLFADTSKGSIVRPTPQAGTQTPETDAISLLRKDADSWEGCGKAVGFLDAEDEKRNADRVAYLRAAADQLARLETERNELRQQLKIAKELKAQLTEAQSQLKDGSETCAAVDEENHALKRRITWMEKAAKEMEEVIFHDSQQLSLAQAREKKLRDALADIASNLGRGSIHPSPCDALRAAASRALANATPSGAEPTSQ